MEKNLCVCGKKYKHLPSLYKHQKGCRDLDKVFKRLQGDEMEVLRNQLELNQADIQRERKRVTSLEAKLEKRDATIEELHQQIKELNDKLISALTDHKAK